MAFLAKPNNLAPAPIAWIHRLIAEAPPPEFATTPPNSTIKKAPKKEPFTCKSLRFFNLPN